jgi:hypothetical protein
MCIFRILLDTAVSGFAGVIPMNPRVLLMAPRQGRNRHGCMSCTKRVPTCQGSGLAATHHVARIN